MTNPSNIYAEKAFAEHPLALWSLDDQLDYISLITESQRSILDGGWTISGGTVSSLGNADLPVLSKPGPFQDSVTSSVKNTNTSQTITLTSPVLSLASDLVAGLEALSVSFYTYYFIQNLSSITVELLGIGGTIQTVKFPSSDRWSLCSASIPLPEFSGTEEIQIVITINLNVEATVTDFSFNGLTLGQQSEEFYSKSLGVTPIDLPLRIPLDAELLNLKAVSASSYGLEQTPAYYLVKDNRLLAKNTGIPLIYGATGLTQISVNDNINPSVIIPGKGFLNKSGKNQKYTAEIWLRVNSDTGLPRRIFGPLASTDGLYVDGPFLTFKIGKYKIVHFISEWYRPMLVHLSISKTSMSLIINGESVGSEQIDMDQVFLPPVRDDNRDYDWLGFYVYDDVPQVEIDCFGIFPYEIPIAVAKRRWVFGQAIDFPENINSSYSGKSIYPDYPFANYSKDYLYPDMGKWGQGVAENISTDNRYLSPAKHKPPVIVFQDTTSRLESKWHSDLSEYASQNGGAIALRPSSSWKDINSYLYFDQISLINQNTKCLYGVFELKINNFALSAGIKQILFFIEDKISLNSFSILVSGSELNGYILEYFYYDKKTDESKLLVSKNLFIAQEAGEDFFYSGSGVSFYAGLHFDSFSSTYKQVANFFGNKSRLKVFVGGNTSFANTFDGYIRKVGFSTYKNFHKVASLFDNSGIPLQDEEVFGVDTYDPPPPGFVEDPENPTEFVDGGVPRQSLTYPLSEHTASYTLFSKQSYGTFSIDLATDSYWEDYVPLSYFAQEVVVDELGNRKRDIDFMQFNIDYPKPVVADSGEYSTFDNLVKTYVSLQNLVATEGQKFEFKKTFENTVEITDASQIVLLTGDNTTRYEVVNGTILNFQDGINLLDFGLVIHVEMVVDGIGSRPIKIKKIQISSKTLSYESPNEIGTRFGAAIYPYENTGSEIKNKAYKTYATSKTTKPYLYLTRDSGIQPIGDLSGGNRGLSIALNDHLEDTFALSALQISMRAEGNDFDLPQPTKFMEIEYGNNTLEFLLTRVEYGRARITVSEMSQNVVFYINGTLVVDPVFSINQWNMISFGFLNSLAFLGKEGKINITWPITINSLSYFQETSLQKVSAGSNRQWFGVLYGEDTNLAGGDTSTNVLEWNDWNGTDSTWQKVLTLSSPDYLGADLKELYSSYTGTAKVIASDDINLSVSGFQYSIYQNMISGSIISKPV
jgi:hypothetical protein